MKKKRQGELNSIQCDTCAAWFHYKCENINTEINTNEWDCSKCLSSVINQNLVNLFSTFTLDLLFKKSVYK